MALVAAGVPGARHEGPAVVAAYVVKRVDSALSAAGPGEIAPMTVATRGAVMPGGTTAMTTAEEWSYGDQWRSVRPSPAGQPVYDEGFSAASVYTLVSYPTRTWARQPELGRPAGPVLGPRGCGPVVAALPLLFQPGLPVQPGLPGIGFSASWRAANLAKLTVPVPAGFRQVPLTEAVRPILQQISGGPLP